MQIISTTPFGRRPVSAALIASQALATQETNIAQFDKWELFRELCVARISYGLTDRDLTVLNALLSFHQGRALKDGENLIVFPSNAALSERAHGMAESTLRRHLAALVTSGVIARHDSPNGKRYAAKNASGAVVRAFGFNLRPLLVKASEIAERAAECRAATEKYRRVREECTVLLRDVVKLSEYGIEEAPSEAWSGLLKRAGDCARAIRRKLPFAALQSLLSDLRGLFTEVRRLLGMIDVSDSNKMNGRDAQNERHYQNSNKDSYDLEPGLEKTRGRGQHPEITQLSDKRDEQETTGAKEDQIPKLPLALVLKACPDIEDYAKDGISSWYDLISTAHFVRGMIGISPDAWTKAQTAMGPENAAIVLTCILQKISDIHSPGGYMRALTLKAENGAFSPGPMVMALLNGSVAA